MSHRKALIGDHIEFRRSIARLFHESDVWTVRVLLEVLWNDSFYGLKLLSLHLERLLDDRMV